MKKILSIILVLVMTVSSLAIPASAETTKKPKVWSGKADTSWYDGESDTYDISTAEQLAGLSKLVADDNSMAGVVINLTADIVLNDTSNWKDWSSKAPANKWIPIGSSAGNAFGYMPFAGVFNGNGHSISGLYVKSPRTAGLFGYVYGSIITGVIIKNGVVISYRNGSYSYAGGIAGIVEKSIINECENCAKIYAYGCLGEDYAMDPTYAGGIAGAMTTENVSGALILIGAAAAGIIINPAIGAAMDGDTIESSTIINCINAGKITAKAHFDAYAGGIAGSADNGNISNSLNVGGGHVGKISVSFSGTSETSKNQNYGGVVGELGICKLSKCYYYASNSSIKGIGYMLPNTSLYDIKDTTTKLTKEKVMSAELVKKLGGSFVYVKGDRPKLAIMK